MAMRKAILTGGLLAVAAVVAQTAPPAPVRSLRITTRSTMLAARGSESGATRRSWRWTAAASSSTRARGPGRCWRTRGS